MTVAVLFLIVFSQTGIRDRDIIDNIEKTLLFPLRDALTRWESKNTQGLFLLHCTTLIQSDQRSYCLWCPCD